MFTTAQSQASAVESKQTKKFTVENSMNIKQLDALQSVKNACSPCMLRDNN